MQKKVLFFLLSFFFVSPVFYGQSTITLDSTVLESRTVISGLDIPWEIIYGPDDHLWVTERYGRISRIDPASGLQNVILDMSALVYQSAESGMLGMALHPEFPDSNYVYVVYTYSSGSVLERLVRFEYDGSSLVDPFIMIDSIAGNSTHIGSRLRVGPDNNLYMSTGDAQNLALPQNPSSLSGKILRIGLDGSIPADNPIAGSPVWSWGHRNPQGLYFSLTGTLFCSEHGPSNDDEFHIIEKGRNYGWPNVEGYCNTPSEIAFCTDSNVVEPLITWTPTIAPSDLTHYGYSAIPEWQDKYLMTVLKDKQLIAIKTNIAEDSVTSYDTYLTNEFGRLRDICVAPDGRIFLATNGQFWSNTTPFTHEIIELRNPATTNLEGETVLLGSIYPNPVRDYLNINIKSQGDAEFQIVDLRGKIVKEGSFFTGSTRVDMSMIPAGLYFIRILSGEKELTKKVIVQ